MSLFSEGDGPNVKDSIQVCLVKIVKALTEPSATVASYPVSGTPNAFAGFVVLKVGPGTVYSVTAYNTNGSTRYLQIFDAASVPANGTVPLAVVQVLTKASGTINLGVSGFNGYSFVNGLVAALSSTDTTFTSVANDGLFTASFI